MSDLVEFQIEVISEIEEQAEMTTSDAQALIEAGFEDFISEQYEEGESAEDVAKEILKQSLK